MFKVVDKQRCEVVTFNGFVFSTWAKKKKKLNINISKEMLATFHFLLFLGIKSI